MQTFITKEVLQKSSIDTGGDPHTGLFYLGVFAVRFLFMIPHTG